MKQWWSSRTSQEQTALLLGAAAVTGLLFYLLIWLPFEQRIADQSMRVKSQQSTLEWMRKSVRELSSLRATSTTSNQPNGKEALLTLVDKTAKQEHLSNFIQRLKPEGSDNVQLWVEQAPFDVLIGWLGKLETDHGVRVESLNIDRQDKPGLVNGHFNLQRGAG